MAVRDHALYRLLDTPAPDAAQGGCYLTHETGPCVDTGILIYTEGTLTISVRALKELAEVAGFSVNEEGFELERRNAELERQVELLEGEKAELTESLVAVGRAIKAAE